MGKKSAVLYKPTCACLISQLCISPLGCYERAVMVLSEIMVDHNPIAGHYSH